MFELFTEGARRAVVMAQEQSRISGDDVIGTEHLLLGLLPDPEIQRVLDRARVSTDKVRPEDGRRVSSRAPASGYIPFTARAKRTMERALRESMRLGQEWVGPAHLLLALLSQPESSAVRTLAAAGVNVDRLAAAAEEVARQTPPPAGAGRASRSGRRGDGRGMPRFPGTLAEGDQPTREQYLALLENYRGLARQNATLVRALDHYGRHQPACRPKDGCTCGLQAVLDGFTGRDHDDGGDDGQRSALDG